MGPHDTPKEVAFYTMDGTRIGTMTNITELKIQPVETEPSERPVVYNLLCDGEMQFSGTLSIGPKRLTRKRFVKLLMGAGVSRNSANYFARVLPHGWSYSDAFRYLFLKSLWRRLAK